ncbi:hypothetical protein F7725_008765 [Dissostichus mawsoni]|uniref:Uncharacterized protein n=1 Tax=Dissostichus mawsoni TaxID=36200 RepID=A0A7J5Y825_DISMA|nr:hypothetical protein F7725_008765 [Dissostichus mawsoni]
MKHSEAAVLTVADLADLFTEEHLESMKEAIDLSLPSVQNNANPIQPTPSDLHDKTAPDPASW